MSGAGWWPRWPVPSAAADSTRWSWRAASTCARRTALDVPNALRRLTASAPESAVFAFHRAGRTFLGATPELLVRTDERAYRSVAIAGSTRRGADAVEDEQLAADLRASAKDREEHAVVVRVLRERLASVSERLVVAPEPAVLRLPHVQHLVTDIEGTLRERLGVLALAGQLHPTPAVCGDPTDLAMAFIREAEGFDRGWYSGPVGWVGADGDGELMVALRCGRGRGRRPVAVRGLRHRGRLGSRPGVGGVAHQAARAGAGDGHPRGRPVSAECDPGERSSGVAVCLRAFVEELVRAGVRDAVVCPGSRSTGLALALAAHDGLRVRVLLDERSAAFFGIGLARATRRPVVLLATSGTAAAEFLPAVVEASLGRVPLVVLTADRPVELRDKGAAQTIDQAHLYGRQVRWFSELPILDGEPATLAHVRWVAGRAVAVAAGAGGAPGPVHLNAPFREPLVPVGTLGAWPDVDGAGGGRGASLGGRW